MTAVKYLFFELLNAPKDKLTWYAILDKALKQEKQQIEQAYIKGEMNAIYNNRDVEWGESDVHNETAEQYYAKNYGIKSMNE